MTDASWVSQWLPPTYLPRVVRATHWAARKARNGKPTSLPVHIQDALLRFGSGVGGRHAAVHILDGVDDDQGVFAPAFAEDDRRARGLHGFEHGIDIKRIQRVDILGFVPGRDAGRAAMISADDWLNVRGWSSIG